MMPLPLFYKDWDKTDHRYPLLTTLKRQWKRSMQNIQTDKEAAIFYALSLDGTADPADKTFTKQKKAGDILTRFIPNEPDHPGIVHYIIHTYDYPELAALALPAARKYASIAPSSAHAQHMPSHIFTRLGLWDECIQSNLVLLLLQNAMRKMQESKAIGMRNFMAMDYLVYAYLQKADNDLAKDNGIILKTIHEVTPANFKVAYAFAAIPARYLLENKMWKEAANLELPPGKLSLGKISMAKSYYPFYTVAGFCSYWQY